MTLSPIELYQAGQLDEAVEHSIELVKKNPADSGLRFQLAELSCVAGDLERADRQLDTVSNQDPQAAVGAALFRQLLRAELARRECFMQGRMPELIGEPSPLIKNRLLALASLREGDTAAAAALIREDLDSGPRVNWNVNGKTVSELRDLDDLLAPILEVHTSTGKYFWIAWNQILMLEARPPKRVVDVLWRQATLSIESGPDGDVYLPTIYLDPIQEKSTDASLRLGRSTDWVTLGDGICRGRGQKTLLVGESDLPLMELKSIEREE